MLRKKKPKDSSTGPPLPQVPLDDTRGFAMAQRMKAEAASNDYRRIAAVLLSLDDWEDLSFVMSFAFDPKLKVLAPWIQQWAAEQPGDLLMRTVLGAAHVTRAWAIRGSGTRDTVGDEQFEMFWAALREADAVLRGVVQEQPGNAVAWRFMFAVAMGLQIPSVERRELFERSNAACPLFVPICVAYHQAICEKWGGSFEESLTFARWVSSQLPDGHHGHRLVAAAHFENSYRHKGEPNAPGAVEEVRAALERSRLASPEWGNDWKGLIAKNEFAIAAWMLGDREVARHMVSLIGLDPQRIGGSWDYLGGGESGAFVKVGRQLELW